MRSRGRFRSSTGVSAVRSCLLLLIIHMSAPVEARRVRGGRAQTRRVQQQQPEQQRMEGPESFPLDFSAVESNMDNFMVQVKNLAQSLYPCSAQKLQQDMKLHLLKNVSVTCNDGSPAGYYIKESKGSRRWLLFLEGDYAFMGSLIIKEVVTELLTKGLDKAKVLLLAGSRYWAGLVPETCRQAHVGEEWNCFFGYKVYPTLKSPVFVVQWVFDEAQLTVDNIHLTGQPVHEAQWRYIENLGQELRSTLRDIPYWMDIQVKGTSLPRALHCWDRSLQSNLHLNGSHSLKKNRTPPLRGCPLHLIDSCPWPHCNPTCPTIRDQLTGQEMSVVQFLKHMGFDVQKMAQQQGMDPKRLLGMLSNGS
ncbi:hypothetical protein GOODEAATRI_013857 [Goodea atripinnis]|uniref:Uncharacterized protein n=1 Tax=Goodea atripinnis TaxID=208336 RepID=A0ABV0PYC1_9TELE